eukprot:Em0012g180a
MVHAKKGNTSEVLRLLNEGGGSPLATATDKNGRTILHVAAVNGQLETVLAILQTGYVDVNTVNKRGNTALHDASTEGHIHITLLLLALGASVIARTRDGLTCLMCACAAGHLQLAKLLLAAGCDLHTCNKQGLTALHFAAWKGHVEVVEMLIKEGASPFVQSQSGKTPLQLAQEDEHKQCVLVLQAATSKMSEEPVYRISTLEGQVRLCQEKLTESHRQHDDILAKERARAEENLAHLRSELTSELQLAQETIEQLRAKGVVTSSEPSKQGAKEEDARPPKGSVAISVSDASMNSPTSEKRRRRKPQKEDLAERSLSPQPIPRSASWADIHAGEGAGPGGLPDAVPGKSSNVGGEKLSITDLVAESLKNPGCIATIRRELKADALTPKIQRKFHVKTTPTSLPSMNDSSSSLEASPLTKENMKVVTPRTRSVLPNTNI